MTTWKPSMVLNVVPGFKGKITGGDADMIRRVTAMYPKPPPRKWRIDECIKKTEWEPNSKSKITTIYLPHGELYDPMKHKIKPNYISYKDLKRNKEYDR